MPKTESISTPETTEPDSVAPVRAMRIDPAHEMPRPEPIPGAVVDAPNTAGFLEKPGVQSSQQGSTENRQDSDEFNPLSPELVQQFRLQAQQLAAHLDARQRDLDRREAELHARLAQQESTARNSRLWFQERHNELLDRENEIDEREKSLSARWAEFDERHESTAAAARAHLELENESTNVVSAQQDELALYDLTLQRRQEELNEQALQLSQREQKCRAREHQLYDRGEQLEAAEAGLARSQVEYDEQRQQFQQQHAEAKALLEQQHTKQIDRNRRDEIDLQKQRAALAARTDELDRRSSALDQLRTDLQRIQRETLEMRLATEELWAQMSGVVPPASITQSLARLRAQLADNFRLQAVDAATKLQEAETLATKVAEQHQRLSRQKREWEHWAASEQRQIEAQAARLVAREQQLLQEHDQSEQARRQLEADRLHLEGELRRLKAQLRSFEAFSAVPV